MRKYAVVNDAMVENVIAADDDTAQEAIKLLIPCDEVIEVTAATGEAWVGGDLLDGKFRAPRPYPSWEWNAAASVWTAPVPYPENDKAYTWSEKKKDWVAVPGSDKPEGPDGAGA